MENTFEIAVEKVVNFWVEKAFKTKINQDNGDNSQNDGMSFMLMNTLSSEIQDDLSENKIKKFKTKLTELLLSKRDSKFSIILIVDYDPCQLLAEALNFAEINSGCMPCKSHTQINMETFEVLSRFKYGSDFVTL